MLQELVFVNLLWVMWALNIFDLLITELGIRHHGLREDNLFLSSLIGKVGWGWFAVLKVAAVSWLHVYLMIIFLEIPRFRPFAWLAVILATVLLGFGCAWNIRLLLTASRLHIQKADR